jgi:hypothetical protein
VGEGENKEVLRMASDKERSFVMGPLKDYFINTWL